MKTFQWLTLCLEVLLLAGCQHYKMFDDCNAVPRFSVNRDTECTPPPGCEVILIDQSVGRIDGRRWILDDESPDVVDSTTFPHTYNNAGNYNIKLIVFSEGCPDEDFTETITIGLPSPVADIEVDRDTCTVGSCTIRFSYFPDTDKVTSWVWKFPNEADNFMDKSIVEYPFNEQPGIFMVILTAMNGDLEDRDTQWIVVEPITFDDVSADLDVGTGAPFEKVVCIQEKEDGGFSAAVNTGLISYLAEFKRNGEYVLNSKDDIEFTLDENYSSQDVFFCYRGDDENLLVGAAFYNLTSTLDVYITGLSNDFTLENVLTPISYPVAGSDGQELGFSATEIPEGGYIVCGQKNTKPPTGMYFLILDESHTTRHFEREA